MHHEAGWVPIALFGALIYGSFSLMLAMVDKRIKNDKLSQVGYGLILSMCSGIVAALIFFLYYRPRYSKHADITLKYINWKVVAATLLFSVMIQPTHTMVMNEGGSVGQQTMYALAIVPVLLGTWYFFGEELTMYQWIGLILAGSGSFLMGYKK